MSSDTINRVDAIYKEDALKVLEPFERNFDIIPHKDEMVYVRECLKGIRKGLEALPSADRPKHYCAECKYEPIDKRCMPCSSCTNNPKNRDAFVSCEVEKKGADDE